MSNPRFVTVAEAKEALNILHNDQDREISDLIVAAEATVEGHVRRDLEAYFEAKLYLKEPFKVAILACVTTWFERIDLAKTGYALPRPAEVILAKYRSFL